MTNIPWHDEMKLKKHFVCQISIKISCSGNWEENCFNIVLALKDQVVAEESVTRIKKINVWLIWQTITAAPPVHKSKKNQKNPPACTTFVVGIQIQGSRGTGRMEITGDLDVHFYRQGESGDSPKKILKNDFTQGICLT